MTEMERPCRVWFDGWGGKRSVRGVVVAETPKRFRVRWSQTAMLARRKWVGKFDETLVPKYAVTFDDERALAEHEEGKR